MAELLNFSGKEFQASFIQAVGDEINQVFLCIGEIWYVVHGLKGSEILTLRQSDDPITLDLELRRLSMISQFEGLKIEAIEKMGEVRSGDGYMISFKGIFDQALIIQSIYSGTKPPEFEDCLRVGVANFIYKV